MSILSSLKQHYRSRFLTALRRGQSRRATVEAASESLEDRALLSSVSFSQATGTAVFNADANDENVLRISSPDADTLVIRSQVASGGILSDDPITLQGDAVGNAGYSLDPTGTVLTIDVTAAGSLTTSVLVNTFEDNDQVFLLSSTAATAITIDGGSGDDSFVVGTTNRLDTLFGDVDFDGGSGDDSLDLLDFESTPSDTIDLTSTSVVGIAPGDVGYEAIESLMIDAADRTPLVLNVLSTAAGVNTVADLTFADASGTPIQSIVTLGNTNAGFENSTGNLDAIAGNLSLVTNSGSVALQIDDSGDASGDNATISATAISGFSAGTINYSDGTLFSSVEVLAGTGDDTINASSVGAPVTLSGGTGDDVLIGSDDDDALLGDAGDDTINGNAGGDFIDGDVGDDSLDGGAGSDTVLGFTGADVIFGGDGPDQLSGEADDDTIGGGLGDDTIEGGDGDDSLGGGEGQDSIDGGFGDDSIDGSSGSDLLFGGLGEDTLLGGNGADSITGGDGVDRIRGGNGRDTINWEIGDGDDDVTGGSPDGSRSGVDRQIVLGTDANEVYVVDSVGGSTVLQVGMETLTIGLGIEELEILSEAGADEIIINDVTGSDLNRVVVRGGTGADRIDGRNLTGAVAAFTGGRGPDVLYGGAGNDTLLGGAGNDTLIGGEGDDSLKGSAGRDNFLWNSGDGSDTIDAGNADDILTANATDGADMFEISVDINGNTLLRNEGFGTLTQLGVEVLQLNTMAGADTVLVGDLSGSDLEVINADLAEGPDVFDASQTDTPVTMRVLGGIGNDRITTGPGDDFLRGAFGNDTLTSGGGQDEVIGDEGTDSITGGAGNDTLNGGGGDDVLLGRSGSDLILGGGGNDRIEGNEGDDIINSASGRDRVAAGDGNDIVSAGNGADTVTGGEGSDVIIGGRGGDDLNGNGGQDILVAGQTTLSDSALARVGAEWVFSRDYADRITNITNVDDGRVLREDQQDTSRLNGDAHLLPITSDRTVLDDDAVDSLNGGAGRDLFFSDFDTDFETDLADDDIVDGRIPSESNIDIR